MGMMAFAQADDALGTIREVFPDENLAQVMAVTLNKSVEDIVTRGELEHVDYIDGANCGIKSLEGIFITIEILTLQGEEQLPAADGAAVRRHTATFLECRVKSLNVHYLTRIPQAVYHLRLRLFLSCAAPAAGTARGLRKHLDIFPLDTLVTGYDNLRDPLARHNLERLV